MFQRSNIGIRKYLQDVNVKSYKEVKVIKFVILLL